ncbi:MAG: gluconokinase [Bdellovibrionota bacterium]
MGLILSIDVGTTNLKAGVVNEKGDVLALRRVQTPVLRPEWGAAEHDPQELYEMIISIGREICKNYRHDVEHIVLSSYQLGLIFIDEHKNPLTGLTLLSDTRARETIESFKEQLDMRQLYQRIGCPPMVQCPLARIYYFKQRKPEIIEQTRYFLSSKDYLLLQFTGEIVTEPSMAGATQMYNLRTREWDQEALRSVGIEQRQLPRVVDGLNTAIPVMQSVRKELQLTSTKLDIFPGIYDGGALSVGLSGLKANVGVMNIGTSAMIRIPGSSPTIDPTDAMLLQPHCLGEDLYLNGGALNNATLPLNWMREKLFELDFNNIPECSKEKGAPIFCLPYLTGERDCKIGPFASGVFFGLRDQHDPQDMLRAVMEGVTYSLCQIKDVLLENGDCRFEEIRAGGGGANSPQWMQMFADIFNAPIALPRGEEIALVGNAMIAYTALGQFGSLAEAAEAMTQVGETLLPNPERIERYAEHYAFFKKLRAQMENLYREHASLQ